MTDLTDRLSADERAGPHPALRPRNAATLIILDRTGAEPRLLMGRRHERHVFMPGKFVFPGGRVDRADLVQSVAEDLHPAVREQIMSGLARRAESRRARAIALAALRETYEEAGLLIGRPGRAERQDQAYDAFQAHGLVPCLSGFICIARAITPPGRSRRFDTRFFAVDSSAIAVALPEGPSGELDGLAWLRFEEALALDLPSITRLVLADLQAALSVGLTPGAAAPFYFMSESRFVREMI